MRITLADCINYSKDAPTYNNGFMFEQSGTEREDVTCLVMWLRRLCRRYDGLSYLLVTSSHVSTGNIKRKTVKTGKVGRPKRIIVGKPSCNHVHGLIISEAEETDFKTVKKEFSDYCTKRRKKRPKLKRQKVVDVWKNSLPIIKYMHRQADSIFKYGTFDFDYFTDVRYMVYEDNFDNILDF